MMDVETITKTITITTLFTTIMVMILDKIYSEKVLFSPPLIPFQISDPIIGLWNASYAMVLVIQHNSIRN